MSLSPSSLAARLKAGPVVNVPGRAQALIADLLAEAETSDCRAHLGRLVADPGVNRLLAGILDLSPYLTGLIRRDPVRLVRLLEIDPDLHLDALVGEALASVPSAASMAEAMQRLRAFKAEVALLAALADLGGVWPVMTVTRALTRTADASTAAAIRFLFRAASTKGDWSPVDPERPEMGSGYIVAGMGKHGAFELNYSSDIDLIVFFEPDLVRLRPGLEPLAFFVRMTRDLVKMLQERTADGYVFRTDLRLRPDPGATQVAIAVPAALNYYQSFGQNWERAALIKARPVAGDLEAGRQFLAELAPFIWRKYLDYAAIADIHAMKRQIHAFKGFGEIGVAGHNIKLGRGGIREIEFFAQTQQLIVGGRQTDLRVPDTLSALERLVERGWILPEVRVDLDEAYRFLRVIEHRLQMVSDEQTQTLPADPTELERLARFCGYPDASVLAAELTRRLQTVQRHYVALFEDVPELTRSGANMVFAGEADDPATVEALARMGYQRPSDIIAGVRGWHHGRYPAVRTPRARELLTEVQPQLIEALAQTGDPDLAFNGFDRFLAELPSGVQLFSLLKANPNLLRLVSDIMGSAPRLARILGRRRRVLDAVLDPGFFGSLPSRHDLERLLHRELAETSDLQELLDRARVVGSEQQFLIGVRVLSGTIGAGQAGGAYAELAGQLIDALQQRVEAHLAQAHGRLRDGSAVVIAMGKLGGREMTAASDLDLIVVYDYDPSASQSDGPRPLAASQYYARFTQRLISALSAPTAEGTLYEVDMRLRPSGQKGPVATQLSSFVEYQTSEAWTWEHLALTRARVISGPAELRQRVETAIREALVRPRDRAKIASDVREMRGLIEKEKGTTDIWDLKQVRGGLVDIEFIAQYLQLIHAHDHPEVLHQNTAQALRQLAAAGLVPAADAETLASAAQLVNNLTQILRLCLDGPFDPAQAPDGLKTLLTRAGEMPDFAHLEASLRQALADVTALFDRLVI
jgi:[glutamine synthetase] adenylyltransferase / [glutamine synthetase]-adenylyl-L-tyrosine phosphorylase